MVAPGLPALKSLDDTETVQSAPKPRWSMTWMRPRLPWIAVPGAPEPRSALAGAVIDSGPVMTPVVTAHAPPVAAVGQVLPAAVEVTVLVRLVLPVSGFLIVTE